MRRIILPLLLFILAVSTGAITTTQPSTCPPGSWDELRASILQEVNMPMTVEFEIKRAIVRTTARCDPNGDGICNLSDMAFVKSCIGSTAFTRPQCWDQPGVISVSGVATTSQPSTQPGGGIGGKP